MRFRWFPTVLHTFGKSGRGKICTKREFAQVGWHTTIALCPTGRSEFYTYWQLDQDQEMKKKNPACRLAQPTPALSQSRVATLGSPPIS